MVTDEQMKELVKFARLPKVIWDNYKQLFKNYNQELLVQICYNINKDLDKYYDTHKYHKTYEACIEVLELLDKWLKSSEHRRIAVQNELRRVANIVSPTACDNDNIIFNYHLTTYDVAHAAYSAARVTYAYESANYTTRSAVYVAGVQSDNKLIIIKTILDYYNEDYQTFEALYL